MKLISEFRHAIVHDKGFLDKTILKDKLFKNQGLTGKELVQKYEEFINIFYGKDEYANLICLTSYIKDTPILPMNCNRRLILTQDILSYGYLLTQLSIHHLDEIKNKR